MAEKAVTDAPPPMPTERVIDLSDPAWRASIPALPEDPLPPGAAPNHTVYARETPEKTRRSKWPNSPHIRQSEPDHYVDIFADHFFSRTHRVITPQTPIGSMGSCFAMRIAHQLQLWKYNYVVEEDDLPTGVPMEKLAETTFRMAPARCGTLFDTPSMRQVVERAFGLWEPPRIISRSNGRIIDPFRTVTQPFHTIEEYEAERAAHTAALRRALLKCDVFVLTLGLAEAWQLATTGDFVSIPQLAVAPELFRRRRLSLQENVDELERILAVYRAHKPDIQLILSVSPVPLNKTFGTDHIVVANCWSKSVLRLAAEELVARHPGVVHYFPSYEAVMYGTRRPWEEDMRHVSAEAIGRVMQLFQKMFLVDQTPLPIAEPGVVFRHDRFRSLRGFARRVRRLLEPGTMKRRPK